MALAVLLFVFLILIIAIAATVFPPHRIAEWLTRGDKKK
jgi:hypothetical protein